MARTHKDDPYWVRLNREGTFTDHDHRFLGRVFMKWVPVLDEAGDPVLEELPIFLSAARITDKSLYGYDYWFETPRRHDVVSTTYFRVEGGGYTEAVRRQARNLVEAGHGGELVQVGVGSYPVRRQVVARIIPDHCTEGEIPKSKNHDLPCTPDIPRTTNYSRQYTQGMSKARAGYSKQLNGSSRLRSRDTLKGVAKEWNAGEDIEDNTTKVEILTNQNRHSMYWMLW